MKKHLMETCAEGGQVLILIALCLLIVASVMVLYPIGAAIRIVRWAFTAGDPLVP